VTAFPASLALAATFDEGLAAAHGTAVAEEARDTGSNVLLGPAVDIARVPLGGRLPEAMGEDPCLTGRLAVAEVRAIQARHVISMVKHFVGNNAETQRTGSATSSGRSPAVNTVVGERALRELYYQPFKAVVQRGGAGSVMGSYNRLNGVYACQHPGILATLKGDWGWDGFVAPDFMHAVRDPVAAANAGLDIPGLGVTEGRTAEDFTSGRIPAERLDEIVRRTLWAIFDAGLDQHPLPDEGLRPALASTPEHVALATRIATDGMVLLANRDRLLPLDTARVGSVAVIGTARDDAQWVMAGSPCVRVLPDRRVTPLEGITARAGAGVRVAFAQGSFGDAGLPVVPAEVLSPAGREGTGLLGEYWNGERPDGEPALTVVDPILDIPRGPRGAGPGALVGPVDGDAHPHRGRAPPLHRCGRRHQPAGRRRGRGRRRGAGVRPAVRRSGAPGQWRGRPSRRPSGQHRARLLQHHRLASLPGARGRRRERPAGLAATGHADPGGRAAGRRLRRRRGVRQHRRRGRDGPLLPRPAGGSGPADRGRRGRQPAHGGGPQHWRTGADAVAGAGGDGAAAWHAGQQFGEAVAAVLFGDADPGGRLPVTFPATPDQGPITGPERWPGVDGDARYDEGVLVGYRWYDEHGQQPLFPLATASRTASTGMVSPASSRRRPGRSRSRSR